MAIDVHVLGTASARPTNDRAVSGSLVKGPNGIAVIDAGEGFQTRFANQRRHLKTSGSGDTLKPGRVNVLAFTHGHLDHTWGALPWLQSMDLENRQQPLLVIGPTSLDAIEALKQGAPFPEHIPSADLAPSQPCALLGVEVEFIGSFTVKGAGHGPLFDHPATGGNGMNGGEASKRHVAPLLWLRHALKRCHRCR